MCREHRQLVARLAAVARHPAVREEAMAKGSLPAPWPGHQPVAELPETRAGHLKQTKSGREALGCRGCGPQSNALPWLVQREEMWPWPPAATCTK